MSNAIQLHQPLIPQSMSEAMDVAAEFAKAAICADAFRGKPADAYMAICYGSELGLAPATSLSSIAVIKGKPTLYAASMMALCLSSDKCDYFYCVEASATSATYETRRKGSPKPQSKTFTQADAAKAGIAGGMYSKYPQRMLEARAKSALARDVYPDILHGLDSYEEIADIPDAEIVTAEFSEPEAPEPGLTYGGALSGPVERINDCKTLDELNCLAATLKEIDKGSELYTESRAAFAEMQKRLK